MELILFRAVSEWKSISGLLMQIYGERLPETQIPEKRRTECQRYGMNLAWYARRLTKMSFVETLNQLRDKTIKELWRYVEPVYGIALADDVPAVSLSVALPTVPDEARARLLEAAEMVLAGR
jgi:hypothetical protein